MPGELLPIMAAPSISKAKLSRAKADLYLIVGRGRSCCKLGNLLTDSSRKKIRFTNKISYEIPEPRSPG